MLQKVNVQLNKEKYKIIEKLFKLRWFHIFLFSRRRCARSECDITIDRIERKKNRKLNENQMKKMLKYLPFFIDSIVKKMKMHFRQEQQQQHRNKEKRKFVEFEITEWIDDRCDWFNYFASVFWLFAIHFCRVGFRKYQQKKKQRKKLASNWVLLISASLWLSCCVWFIHSIQVACCE